MKMKIFTVVLAAMMLASCGTVEPEETSVEDTVMTEDTVFDSKIELKLETPEKKMQQTAYWFDANCNFSRDGSDDYFVDMKQVSMADYYDALNKNEELAAFDAYSRFVVGNDVPMIPYDDSCDYLTFEVHSNEWYGTESLLPQFNFGTEDAVKANEEIVQHMGYCLRAGKDYPEYSIKHIEREDGSKTVVLYYTAFSENSFWVYNFDKDGNRMTNAEVLESAGYDADTFLKDAEDKIRNDAQNASVYYALWGGIDTTEVMRSFYNKEYWGQQLYINEDGAVVFILHLDGNAGTPMGGFFPYAIEKGSDPVYDIDHTTPVAKYDAYFTYYLDVLDYIENGTLDEMPQGQVVSIDSIDLHTPSPGLDGYLCSLACGTQRIAMRRNRYRHEFVTQLNNLCHEDGDYRYEFYRDGQLVDSGSVHMTADPYYAFISFEYSPEEDGDYLVVVYEKDSDDQVFAGGWFSYEKEPDYYLDEE